MLPIPIIVIFSQIKINLGYNSFFSRMYVTTNQTNRLTPKKKIPCHIYEITTGIYVNTHTFTPNPYCNILVLVYFCSSVYVTTYKIKWILNNKETFQNLCHPQLFMIPVP